MNQDTLTRLGWVIEAVEKAPPRKFNMNYWENFSFFCGTTHCAIGWACQDQRVQATGLSLIGTSAYKLMPGFGNSIGFGAIASWLDIPYADARQLFGRGKRAGKSKEEVLERLKAYRAIVQYELERWAITPEIPGDGRQDTCADRDAASQDSLQLE